MKIQLNNNLTVSQEVQWPLPRSFQVMDVPADGNCLFWAAALAYLLSLNNDQFEEGFKRLFGEENLAYLPRIKVLIEEFASLDIRNFYTHPLLSVFIGEIFRERVVVYMDSHREAFESSTSIDFDSYLEAMLSPGTWGGEPEIKAISDLLDCTIFVVPTWQSEEQLTFGIGIPKLYLLHRDNHYYFALDRKKHSFFIKEFHVMANQLELSTSETESKTESESEDTDFDRSAFHQEFRSIIKNWRSFSGKEKNEKKFMTFSSMEKWDIKAVGKFIFELIESVGLGAFLELSLHIHFSAAACTYFFFREQVEVPLSILNYPLVIRNLEVNTKWENKVQKEIDCYLAFTTCSYVGLSGALIGSFYALFQQCSAAPIKKGLKQMTSATLSYFFSKPQNDKEEVSSPGLGLHKRVAP